MRVAETFSSLQGEGILAGTPSFFIRTSGCNLRCVWCDTPYASWQAEGTRWSVTALVQAAGRAGLLHVVVTGGEPLIQPEIGELTAALVSAGHHVTVETAGTIAAQITCSLLSLSPKTANSDPPGERGRRHAALRARLEAPRALLERHPEHQLKFVVRGAGDMEEILAVVEALGACRDRVLLMPEGRSAEEIAGRAPVVAALCLAHGLRYSPRLHIDLYGGRRGA